MSQAAIEPAQAAIDPAPTRAAQRHRLAMLVRIAASAGDFSPKLSKAVERATDEEVRLLADLVRRGLSIPRMVNVLQGAHVLIGDDDLYAGWIFPTSRQRLSSHHRTVDKRRTPDYGLDGPLVREALHGKAVAGTWIQLERTKATFKKGQLPRWHDLIHIRDYLLYRITKKNVGPWGLSANVDTRPILLRPPAAVTARESARALGAFGRLRTEEPAESSGRTWADVLSPDVAPVGPAGDLFAAPVTQEPGELLPRAAFAPDLGHGLFGELPLLNWTAPLRPSGIQALTHPDPVLSFDPPHGIAEPVAVQIGARELKIQAHVIPAVPLRQVFIGIEEEQ